MIVDPLGAVPCYWVTVKTKVALCNIPLAPEVEAVIVTELVPRGVIGEGSGDVPQPTTDMQAPKRAAGIRIIHTDLPRDIFILLRPKTQNSRQLPIAIRPYEASSSDGLPLGADNRDVLTSVVIVKFELMAAPFGVMVPGLNAQAE